MEKDDDDEHHQPLHSHPMSYPQLKHRGWVPNLLRHMFQGTEGEDGVRQPWSDHEELHQPMGDGKTWRSWLGIQ